MRKREGRERSIEIKKERKRGRERVRESARSFIFAFIIKVSVRYICVLKEIEKHKNFEKKSSVI